MPKKEKKREDTHKKTKSAGRISRRQFTIGSMAIIGSDPLVLADVSADTPPLKLEIPDEIRQIMVDRHILKDDLIRVIDHAEKTGVKLYQQDSGRFLAKLRMNEVYFYAEYSTLESGYLIHNTYSHRFLLEEGT